MLELQELKYTLLSETLRAASSCRLTESQKYLDDIVNFSLKLIVTRSMKQEQVWDEGTLTKANFTV